MKGGGNPPESRVADFWRSDELTGSSEFLSAPFPSYTQFPVEGLCLNLRTAVAICG